MYNGLNVEFKDWNSENDVKTDIFALHIDNKDSKNSRAICLQGNINDETAKAYTQKINMFKHFSATDFSLSDYKKNEYGVGDISLINDIWKDFHNLIDSYITIRESGEKSITDKVEMTITKITINKKHYYFVANQEPTEKLYKKKKIYSVGDKLKSLKPKEFFMMNEDFDCIIDEEQKCFYSLKNSNVIKRFNLKEAIKKEVKKSEAILDEWNFIENVEEIKNCIGQQNVYEPLFKIFKDKNYSKQLKSMTAIEFKSRVIRVSKGKITESDFKMDKFVIAKSNRAMFLDLLAKKMKYNIATDGVEE